MFLFNNHAGCLSLLQCTVSCTGITNRGSAAGVRVQCTIILQGCSHDWGVCSLTLSVNTRQAQLYKTPFQKPSRFTVSDLNRHSLHPAGPLVYQGSIFKTHMCCYILGTFHTQEKKMSQSSQERIKTGEGCHIFKNKLHSFNKQLEVLMYWFSSRTWPVSLSVLFALTTWATSNNLSLSWPWIINAWFVQSHLYFPYMLQHAHCCPHVH